MYYDAYHTTGLTSFGIKILRKANSYISTKILALFKTGDVKFLEIGHGRGLFAKIFMKAAGANHKITYYGIEPNQALHKEGLQKGFNLENTRVPPFPEKSDWKNFDCVYMSHVLEHFSNYESVLNVLKDINSIIKNEGVFVLVFPDFLDWQTDFWDIDYSHGYVLTKRRALDLLIDSGFEAIEVIELRGHLRKPFSTLLFPFIKIIEKVAGGLYSLLGNNIFFKMKITLKKNILIAAKKSSH